MFSIKCYQKHFKPFFSECLGNIYLQTCANLQTEFIIFGSQAQLKKLDPYLPVRIFGNFMHPTVVVKNLGVWFDANFSFADHVRNICKTCFIQIRDLRWVRKHLTDEAAILAANALVTSRLDYCNSLQEYVQSQHAQTTVYSKHTC